MTRPGGLQGTGVSGDAAAVAEGGTATTDIDAKANERRAMMRATAQARTEDERARSRTRTTVTPNDVIRSRTTSTYKTQGEKPVRETVTTAVCSDGRKVEKVSDCRGG